MINFPHSVDRKCNIRIFLVFSSANNKKVSTQHQNSSLGGAISEANQFWAKVSNFSPLSRIELFGKKVETRKCKMNWTFLKVCHDDGKSGG